MALILGVVADDFTGGMEIASMLVKRGVACAFVTDPNLVDSISGHDAIVVARRIRTVAADKAVEEATRAACRLIEAGARQIFFKYCATFDSTDEGNIGPVADRLAEITDAETVLFCPTFPEADRTVYNGHLFVGSQLVSDSPKRFDPVTPMHDPRLVDVLQRQSCRSVGLLRHSHVRVGPEAIRREVAALRKRGARHLIVDATSPEDLAAIAGSAFDMPLLTGNSSVAEYLPGYWESGGWFHPKLVEEPPPVDGPAVVLAGSCADQTLLQLKCFSERHPVLHIDLRRPGSVDKHVEEAFTWAALHLDSGPVAIATSADPQTVGEIQALRGRTGSSETAEAILAGVAIKLRDHGVKRFTVAGGETSGAVIEALGIDRLHIGRFREPGIALATTAGPYRLGLCLKSGKLGPADLFLNIFDLISSRSAEECSGR